MGSRSIWAAHVALLLVVLTTNAKAGERKAHRPHRSGTVRVDSNRPRSAFECDLPGGGDWFGSTERCLQELCVGDNVTNEHTRDRDGRIRRNPCYGRDPFELER